MKRWIAGTGLVLATVTLPGVASPEGGVPYGGDPEIVVVRMVDISPTEFAFEPSEFEVSPGDRVRFVQTGVMPHNVEFTKTPEGADLGEARVGPFLTAKDQTYEITIDDRFSAGTYAFVCTPHAALGMAGTLTVAGSR